MKQEDRATMLNTLKKELLSRKDEIDKNEDRDTGMMAFSNLGSIKNVLGIFHFYKAIKSFCLLLTFFVKNSKFVVICSYFF